MKRFYLICLLSTMVIAIATITGCRETKKEYNLENVYTDSIDTIQVNPQMVANQMLEQKEFMNQCYIIDSVFRQMPDEIIVTISLKNPDYSYSDITTEYLKRKKEYDEWYKKYFEIEKFKNHPDTTITTHIRDTLSNK